MGLSVGNDLLQMDKACRDFNRQPNKLRPLTFLALVIGSWPLAPFSPTQLQPIMPCANTRCGFLQEELPGSSRKPRCLRRSRPPGFCANDGLISLRCIPRSAKRQCYLLTSPPRCRKNVLNFCVHLHDATVKKA